MMNIDVKLTKELIKTTDDLRRKFKALKNNRQAYESRLEEAFKPITVPLNELVKQTPAKVEQNKEKKEEVKDNDYYETPLKKIKTIKYLNDEFITLDNSIDNNNLINSTPKKPKEENATEKIRRCLFTENLSDEHINKTPKKYMDLFINNSNSIDRTYGIHSKDGKLFIGNGEFSIHGQDIRIKNKIFQGTKGLYELIFKKHPQESTYNNEDLKNYETIIYDTNVYRKAFDSQKQVNGNRGYKYTRIIRPLIEKTSSSSSFSNTLPIGKGLMQLSNNKKDYIFWDDPNELVDRLRLLIGSHQAGHNNHSNEIISIIEELKEANIIF